MTTASPSQLTNPYRAEASVKRTRSDAPRRMLSGTLVVGSVLTGTALSGPVDTGSSDEVTATATTR